MTQLALSVSVTILTSEALGNCIWSPMHNFNEVSHAVTSTKSCTTCISLYKEARLGSSKDADQPLSSKRQKDGKADQEGEKAERRRTEQSTEEQSTEDQAERLVQERH